MNHVNLVPFALGRALIYNALPPFLHRERAHIRVQMKFPEITTGDCVDIKIILYNGSKTWQKCDYDLRISKEKNFYKSMALCAWDLTMGQQNVSVYFLGDGTSCERWYLWLTE